MKLNNKQYNDLLTAAVIVAAGLLLIYGLTYLFTEVVNYLYPSMK